MHDCKIIQFWDLAKVKQYVETLQFRQFITSIKGQNIWFLQLFII